MKQIKIGLLLSILCTGFESCSAVTTREEFVKALSEIRGGIGAPVNKSVTLLARIGSSFPQDLALALIHTPDDQKLLDQAFAVLNLSETRASSLAPTVSQASSVVRVASSAAPTVSQASSVALAAQHVPAPSTPATLQRYQQPHAHRSNPQRIQVLRDTLQLIQTITVNGGWYTQPDGTRAQVTVRPVQSIDDSFSLLFAPPQIGRRTQFFVTNEDTLDAAKRFSDSGIYPAVLDMANRHYPGGTAELTGSSAQEEQLCYRTNLLPILKQYAATIGAPFIPEFGALYVPQIIVLRAKESDGYSYLPRAFYAAVIASAAYNKRGPEEPAIDPRLGGPDAPSNQQQYIDGTKEKIRSQLGIALVNGQENIILGAFGCGAFKNDPAEMVNFYSDVLKEPRFKNQFRTVTFAVFDPTPDQAMANPRSNLYQFKRMEHLNDDRYY